MEYVLKASELFMKHITKLDRKSRKIIKKKVLLIKENPYRNKKIYCCDRNLFRIRFSDRRKQKRLIYEIKKNEVRLLCILDRNHDYKDMVKYIKNIGWD